MARGVIGGGRRRYRLRGMEFARCGGKMLLGGGGIRQFRFRLRIRNSGRGCAAAL